MKWRSQAKIVAKRTLPSFHRQISKNGQTDRCLRTWNLRHTGQRQCSTVKTNGNPFINLDESIHWRLASSRVLFYTCRPFFSNKTRKHRPQQVERWWNFTVAGALVRQNRKELLTNYAAIFFKSGVRRQWQCIMGLFFLDDFRVCFWVHWFVFMSLKTAPSCSTATQICCWSYAADTSQKL